MIVLPRHPLVRPGGRVVSACLVAALLQARPGAAQTRTDSVVRALPTLTVTVDRGGARSPLLLPFAISSIEPDSARPGLRHLSADELLFATPGVFVANRTNPTQDPRITVRGFGARSAFGVRGVRLMRDGIPLTVADGQTPVDYLDLESVGRVEVLRGSAGSLYGASSGGVVEVRTSEAPVERVAGRGTVQGGSWGLSRFSVAGGGRAGPWRYQGDLSRLEQDGYRTHSAQRLTSGSLRTSLERDSSDVALLFTALDMPQAFNPGALTEPEWKADPRAADPAQVRRGARKDVTQAQLGMTARRRWSWGELGGVVHGGRRALDNPLTFAIVDVERATYGSGISIAAPARFLGVRHRLQAGLDAQWQDDDRLNFANCNDQPPLMSPTNACPVVGEERGVVRLDQRERVANAGPYVRDEVAIGDRVLLTLGARADWVEFRVDDHLVTPPDRDDSGERTMRAISPMVGAVVRLGDSHALHASWSRGFDTPTATELANQPDGSAGLNPALDPQYATTAEVGAKGVLGSRVRWDVALFHTRTEDELIPFETTDGSGRRYFRNAGETRRRGAEAGMGAALGALDVAASYTWSDFTFTDYVVTGTTYDGNRIPGVPMQLAQAHGTWRFAQGFLTVEGLASGSVVVDDANATRAPGYELMHTRAGIGPFGKRVGFLLMGGVHNVFDRRYAGSVVANAAGGRWVEPAPERTVFLSVSLTAR